MVYNKRKKNSRQRGSWTHGWGEKKKHRGAGSRGGRGHAGSGKRGDVKKPTYQKLKRVFGRNGFTPGGSKPQGASINISYLETISLEGKAGVAITKDKTTIDLSQLGYDKLLGAGKITRAYEVTVKQASKSAIDKVQQAGGKVVLPEDAQAS